VERSTRASRHDRHAVADLTPPNRSTPFIPQLPKLVINVSSRLYELNSNPPVEIDLTCEPWCQLLPERLAPFGVEEIRRPNNIYPDGILPGSVPSSGNCISTKIQTFPNYLEWSKVTIDNVVELPDEQATPDGSDYSGDSASYNSDDHVESPKKVRFHLERKTSYFVTSIFFEQRSKGWSQPVYTPKPGRAIGYIFNGTAYHIRDTSLVEDIVFSIVYKSIIERNPLIHQLQQICRAGTLIRLHCPVNLGIVIRILNDTILEPSSDKISV
jgi:hypothetical protein